MKTTQSTVFCFEHIETIDFKYTEETTSDAYIWRVELNKSQNNNYITIVYVRRVLRVLWKYSNNGETPNLKKTKYNLKYN